MSVDQVDIKVAGLVAREMLRTWTTIAAVVPGPPGEFSREVTVAAAKAIKAGDAYSLHLAINILYALGIALISDHDSTLEGFNAVRAARKPFSWPGSNIPAVE